MTGCPDPAKHLYFNKVNFKTKIKDFSLFIEKIRNILLRKFVIEIWKMYVFNRKMFVFGVFLKRSLTFWYAYQIDTVYVNILNFLGV